ncbi:MAG: four helix bundle protein [Dehalococcoidia bacterium]|nr:four helix bundle protein [Dehalococcoidia bacterium]
METQGFKQLVAWQKGYQLSLDIYKATGTFPSTETYGLASQMRRAAVSIPANIAEGYNRQYRKEYLQFLSIASGSLAELETYLLLARDLGYLQRDRFNPLDDVRKDVGRVLSGLIKSLRRTLAPRPLTPDP